MGTVRMSSWVAAAMAVVVVAAALGGCAGAPGRAGEHEGSSSKRAAFPVALTDDAGRKVTIGKRPTRIVSLTPATTEIVYALGADDRLVGVTTWCDYPAAAKSKPKMGDFSNPNLEAIAGARPDIVLVTGGVQADVIGKLEKLGAKVLTVDPQTLTGVFASIGTVGRAIGETTAAERVVGGMKSDLEGITAKVGSAPRTAAFIEVGWNPLFTAGSGTLLDDMLTAAGGRNVVAAKSWVAYSTEQLVKDQPQAYLGTVSSIGDAAGLSRRPGYGGLSAVREGRVFTLDDNLVSRPGPRIVDGVRLIAEAIHPEAFGK